mmetsp:Transcript_49995/g.159910  ORF Transcript_49995/g.159910 Transcript_49995/m.159910 type:complete len:269 (+) Transcript_49995:77-883(+)
MATSDTETLTISDGTTLNITRIPDVDDETWAQVKSYLQDNPDAARAIQGFAKRPEAMRGWLQTQAIADYFNRKLSGGDKSLEERLKGLEHDPELKPIFEDIRKNGLEAAMKHCKDDELMIKFSRKMGGLPEDLQPTLKKIDETPLTIHEAAMMGDLKAVQAFLEKSKPLDAQDPKGITPLGYAIGANRIAVVKLLLDSRANPYAVDASGNSGLHYAAGYGRKELLEYLLKIGGNVNQSNAQGQTPIAAAAANKHQDTIKILQAHGATM